ncbi:MAG: MBL fold metallo-hydrolase [Clostridia bacterium]|nr:MBL fold metallo-hydrolase [Clostridia bacterium]
MRIEWIGHACFKLTLESGVRVFTDPYDQSVGIAMIPLKADVITMSHEHHDHNETSQIIGEPVILHGDAPLSLGGLRVSAHASYHDEVCGAKRGSNFIRIFECEGLKVVHMGDQGCMPGEDVLAAIAGADVLMIPVGGTYTLNAKEAKDVIARIAPKCVVPMHVKTAHCPYPIDPVGVFLEEMDCAGLASVPALEVSAGNVPNGVVLMKPMADEL